MDNARILLDIFNEVGLEVRVAYSGRCMYGKTCIAVIHSHGHGWIAEVLDHIISIECNDSLLVFSNALKNACEDSMGLDTITYFPGYSIQKKT